MGLLQRPHRHLHDALVVVGAGAGLVLGGGDAEEQHRADPAAAISVASATSSEIEKRSIPGIDSTSSRTPSPATTKAGWIRCAGDSSVSGGSAGPGGGKHAEGRGGGCVDHVG